MVSGSGYAMAHCPSYCSLEQVGDNGIVLLRLAKQTQFVG